jgi:ABC-type transport system involved in multi-copper enzyme maturation permease subunit
MIGPVLHQEMLLGSRRNQLHLFRWVYAGWLILQVLYLYFCFLQQENARQSNLFYSDYNTAYNPASAPEVVGHWFAELFVWQEMLLLVLVTPAFVAGAITDEKRRGTLQYLLTADLDARHIVLGKLLGRVAQVALVALAGLPLFALLAGFGAVHPLTLLMVAVVQVVPLLALASATVLASVWCRQTRDAVLALYVLCGLGWLAVWWFGGLLDYLNPLYVIEPAWGPGNDVDPGEAGARLLGSVLGWGVLGGVCLALAVWRLRPAYIRELEHVAPKGPHWYSTERAPVYDEPVHWRERHVEGLAPTPSLRRVPQWLGITLVAVLTVVSSVLILVLSMEPGKGFADVFRALLRANPGAVAGALPDASLGFLVQSLVLLLLATFVVGIRCSGAVTGEREKQTWEALLLTPLSAKQLIRGKLWGIMGASYWYLLAYAAPAVLLSVFGGLLALFWTVLWLAVTVLGVYFIGATGLWCSVKSKNSWRALLSTVVIGYVGGAFLYMLTSPLIVILAFILQVVRSLAQTYGTPTAAATVNTWSLPALQTPFLIASSVALAAIFWLWARILLARSQRWIADRERTRHWHEEPLYRRSRRPAPVSPSV